ncbi:DUF6188 family protein [Glycomyces xiaoerkulensis]|uniref:DUF6188 family protein n=1 Tax=Glycomyces xiaoerkulensis TaxID=2038139 RepID=UPI000C259798|nr:DUF6188 family protein [Glycomyces xiaoerkulensis]
MRIDDLNGQLVTEVSWKPPVTLRTGGGWVLTVDSEMTVTRAGGDRVTYPGDDKVSPETAYRELSGLIIDRVEVGDAGDLRFRFEDGSTLEAPPDPNERAWRLAGPEGQRFACAAGGEVSVEPATRSALAATSGRGAPGAVRCRRRVRGNAGRTPSGRSSRPC